MKILLLNQFFWPDSAATSQLLTDLARGLAQQGHTVYAIAADGGYAVTDAGDPPPVQIHRVRALPFARGRLGRVLSYLSFYVGAAARGLTLPRPDLVLTLTTPPLLSLLGTLIHTLRGSRHFIWRWTSTRMSLSISTTSRQGVWPTGSPATWPISPGVRPTASSLLASA